MYDQKIAEKHLKKLLRHYKIHVYQWSKSSCGRAYYKQKRIKIPHPTNPDRFCVCMHEVKHIIDGAGRFSFEDEYNADKFALEQLRELGFDGEKEWISRMKWHVLSRIAMAHNRRLDHKNISKEIRDFFPEVDFSYWVGKKIFVSRNKESEKGYKLHASVKFTRKELEVFLEKQNLVLEKSEIDDSTYGKWIVRELGKSFGTEFDTLSEIAEHFKFRP